MFSLVIHPRLKLSGHAMTPEMASAAVVAISCARHLSRRQAEIPLISLSKFPELCPAGRGDCFLQHRYSLSQPGQFFVGEFVAG